MQVQPYLFFEGRTEEALEFYKRALGAKVTAMMRNKEAPEKPPPGMLPPNSEEKILHAAFKIGDTEIMASDGTVSGKPDFKGVTLSLVNLSEADAGRYFKALSDGGQVQMPLTKTFFAPKFGIVSARFGVHWMVVAAA